MCFDGGVNLFFHVFVPDDLANFTEAIRCVYNVGVHRGEHGCSEKRKSASRCFLQFLKNFLRGLSVGVGLGVPVGVGVGAWQDLLELVN